MLTIINLEGGYFMVTLKVEPATLGQKEINNLKPVFAPKILVNERLASDHHHDQQNDVKRDFYHSRQDISLDKNHNPEKEKNLTLVNDLLLKHFDDYIAEIESLTKITMSESQKSILREYSSTKPLKVLMSDEKHTLVKEYNSKRRALISSWLENNGKKANEWPRTTGKELYNGKLITRKPAPYCLHHIISTSCGGPNEWWNIFPTPYIIHQKYIHGANSVSNKIFRPSNISKDVT